MTERVIGSRRGKDGDPAVLGALASAVVWSGVGLVTFVHTCVMFVVFLLTVVFDRNAAWCHRVGTQWGRSMIRLMPGWRLRTEGLEHLRGGPFVIVANHQSRVDIWVTFFLPTHFKWLSKSSVFNTPFMGWMMRMCRYIPVTRGDRRSVVRSLATSVDWIRRGVSVVIFPEGTRSTDGQIGPFKPGAFVVASRTGAPVLPVVILGTREALPKGTRRFGAKCDFRLIVGPPISSEGLTSSELNGFATRVRDQMVAMKEAAEGVPSENGRTHPVSASG